MVGVDSFALYPESRTNMYVLKRKKLVVAKVDLKEYLKKLDNQYDTTKESYHDINLPAEKLTMDIEADSMQLRFLFKNITMERNLDKIRISQIEAEVLSRHK
jgi:hypothetical protein